MEEIYLSEGQLKRKRLFFRLKLYVILAAFFVLVGGLAYVVVYSPLFRVKSIFINEINSDKSVLDDSNNLNDLEANIISNAKLVMAKQSVIASLLGADNILIWGNGALSKPEFLRENFPQISYLDIKKDYFKKEISIDFEERSRFGIWCNKQKSALPSDASGIVAGQGSQSSSSSDNIFYENKTDGHSPSNCFWFDKNGIIFSLAPEVEGDLIYNVSDYTGRGLKLGDRVLGDDFIGNLMRIFDTLGKSGLGIKSLRLDNLDLEEITAESPSNNAPKLYFSLRFDPGFALNFLKSINQKELQKLSYIDLRVENRVYYK